MLTLLTVIFFGSLALLGFTILFSSLIVIAQIPVILVVYDSKSAFNFFNSAAFIAWIPHFVRTVQIRGHHFVPDGISLLFGDFDVGETFKTAPGSKHESLSVGCGKQGEKQDPVIWTFAPE